MSSGKSVLVIGGGLYGCLTAYQIAQKHPEINVHLIEAGDHLLTAFDPIELSGVKLNNGFHGIELPRAQGLFDFIRNTLKIDFQIKKNSRALSIQGNLIPFEAKLTDWPSELKTNFLMPGPVKFSLDSKLDPFISKEYELFLNKVASRYSDTIDDVKGLIIPWFLPSDYTLSWQDEGNQFRSAVMAGDVIPKYGHPPFGLFAELIQDMEKVLKSVNVDIHYSTKVKFSGEGLEFIQLPNAEPIATSKEIPVFYCATLALILKDVSKDHFAKLLFNKRSLISALLEFSPSNENKALGFSEILCADENATHIARISFPCETGIKYTGNKKLIQVEVFIKPGIDIEKLRSSLSEDIDRILMLKQEEKSKLLDLKPTRDVFFPSASDQSVSHAALVEWANQNHPNLKMRTNFGPINMAKAWAWAQENANMI